MGRHNSFHTWASLGSIYPTSSIPCPRHPILAICTSEIPRWVPCGRCHWSFNHDLVLGRKWSGREDGRVRWRGMEGFDRRCLEFKRFGNSVDGRGSGGGRRGGRSPWYVSSFFSFFFIFFPASLLILVDVPCLCRSRIRR